MLWLGIFLPRLPIEVFLRGLPCHGSTEFGTGAPMKQAPPAIAVCDRLHVLLASESAQALGVTAGMKRSTALALASELQLLERNLRAEHETLMQLATWALQFTPSVSLQQAVPAGAFGHVAPTGGAGRRRTTNRHPATCDAGLLLEVEPSLTLFGGIEALVERIRTGIEQQGLHAQLAGAPTATGAWLLARQCDWVLATSIARLNALLGRLPVTALDGTRPHLEELDAIGIRSFNELQQLPRAGLARRFGNELLAEIDRALGRQPDPRPWFEAPVQFDARLELFAQVENAQALLSGARHLLIQLTGWLSARHAAVSEVRIAAEHDDRPPTPIELRLAEPSRDLDRMLDLLRETLAVTKLAAPVHTLRLHCGQVSALAASNTEMFPVPASMTESLGRLVERLGARLGRDRVQRLVTVQDHRPESAYRLEAVGPGHVRQQPVLRDSPSQSPQRPDGALPRPLWLLRQPISLTERNNRPYWQGPLTLLAGPERIESGWWDNALVQRDYFIAIDESDAMLWIYRERLPDAQSHQGWFLQGRFG